MHEMKVRGGSLKDLATGRPAGLQLAGGEHMSRGTARGACDNRGEGGAWRPGLINYKRVPRRPTTREAARRATGLVQEIGMRRNNKSTQQGCGD